MNTQSQNHEGERREVYVRRGRRALLADHPDRPDPGDDDAGEAVQCVLFPILPTNEPGATAGTAAPGMEV